MRNVRNIITFAYNAYSGGFYYGKWQERLNRTEVELLKKIICIDGKTMRSKKKGTRKHPLLYRRGVKKMDSVLDKKQ